IAALAECLRPDLDLARGGRETARLALRVDPRVLGMMRRERDADSRRFRAELLQGHAACVKLMPISGIDVAVPERFGEVQAYGEIEDEIRVGACLAAGRYD